MGCCHQPAAFEVPFVTSLRAYDLASSTTRCFASKEDKSKVVLEGGTKGLLECWESN